MYCVKCKTKTKTIDINIVQVQVGKDKLKTRYRETGICENCNKNKSRFTSNKIIEEEVPNINGEDQKR